MYSYLLDSKISFQTLSSELHIYIETERLLIRSYKDEDFDFYQCLLKDKDLTKYFDHGKPWEILEIQNLILLKGTKFFLQGLPFGIFSIFCKLTNAFIGIIDFLPTEINGVIEVGFILNKEHHHQGFCLESLKAITSDYIKAITRLEFQGNKLFINEIIATSHPNNLPSIKVLQKAGMIYYKSEERFNQPRFWFSLKINNEDYRV